MAFCPGRDAPPEVRHRVKTERYMAKAWNDWYQEEKTECGGDGSVTYKDGVYDVNGFVQGKEMEDGMKEVVIGREIVNAWLGGDGDMAGSSASTMWADFRKRCPQDGENGVKELDDWDLARKMFARNAEQKLEAMGETPESIARNSRTILREEVATVEEFADMLSELISVGAKELEQQCCGYIMRAAAEEEERWSGEAPVCSEGIDEGNNSLVDVGARIKACSQVTGLRTDGERGPVLRLGVAGDACCLLRDSGTRGVRE